MASAGQMAEFFATLGFKIDKADIKKVDKQLDALEARARRLSEQSLSNIKLNISRFGFSDDFNTRLHKALKARMRVVSNKGISPEITVNKFDIDRNALLRDTRDAIRYVENNLTMRIRPNATRPQNESQGVSRYSNGISRFGAGMGVGAAAGSLGRGFIPGLGLAFGVSQMNRLNQQLIGQELAATAVFGNQEAGQEQLDWIRSLGNQLGFDYRSQANAYMKMAAAGTTAGMGTNQVQDIFTSMAEYGRVMGLNDEDMKGSMRAVEQMLNKGQVYAEELKMQLGEKFPAAIQLMAEAVSGGDTEKLFDMMEKGEVSSIEALPEFARILSIQARKGGALTEAMKTSLAEQMRFNNSFNDMVMAFSEAGFEEGQSGIFRTMNDFIKNMTPLIQSFGEAWKYVGSILRVPLGLLHDLGIGIETLAENLNVSKGAVTAVGSVVGLLVFPFTRTITVVFGLLALLEDFTAFLTGRGSLIGDWLQSLEKTNPELLVSIKSLFENIKTLGTELKELWGELSEILFTEQDMPFVKVLQGLVDDLNSLVKLAMKLTGRGDEIEEGSRDGGLFKIRKDSVADFILPKNWGTRYDTNDIDKSSLGGQLEFWQSIVEKRTFASLLSGAETAATVGSLGMINFGNPEDNPYMYDSLRLGNNSSNTSNVTENRFDIKIDVTGLEDASSIEQAVDNAIRDSFERLSEKGVGSE